MQSAYSIFAELPEESLPSGTVLCRRGERPNEAVFIESGRIVLGLIGHDSQINDLERQVGTAQGPCWLEAASTILGMPSAVDVVAQTDIRLRRLPLDQFKAYLRGSAPGVLSMLTDMARANHAQTELAIQRMAKDAEARCAAWLLNQAQTNDHGEMVVQLHQYKRAIAAQLGIVPETLSRVLRQLRELRLISGKGRQVCILNPSGMRELAGQPASRPH